jgi:4-deoxy-L-threo-5-hexosulose-uronate ketol-isomerase
MEQRYATSPEHVPGMDTAELRKRYLVQDLFVDDEVNAVYTHHDRVVLVGVSPVTRAPDIVMSVRSPEQG